MGSFEPLQRDGGRLNHVTPISGSWSKMPLLLRWIDIWYLSRILEALPFSTSLSPYSFDAYLLLGEWRPGILYRIIWRLFKNIELKGRLSDVTGVEI